jgi:hypothetical protein
MPQGPLRTRSAAGSWRTARPLRARAGDRGAPSARQQARCPHQRESEESESESSESESVESDGEWVCEEAEKGDKYRAGCTQCKWAGCAVCRAAMEAHKGGKGR